MTKRIASGAERRLDGPSATSQRLQASHAMTPFLDDAPRPGRVLLARLRRHPFLCSSLLLHAALLAALGHVGGQRSALEQGKRQQALIESGARLTQQARLERRVQDMARIKSMLEQSAAAGGAQRPSPSANHQEDTRFDTRAKAPQDLLQQAAALARTIDEIERDIKAQQLAKLLGIPKAKAVERLERARKPERAPAMRPVDAAAAAAQIARLEAQARAALERRRRQLAQQREGTRLAASAAQGAGTARPANARPTGKPAAGRRDEHGVQQGRSAQEGLGGQGRGIGKGGNGGEGEGEGAGNGDGLGRGSVGGAQASSLLARMAEFDNPDLPEGATQAYRAGGLGDIFDTGVGRIPDVGAGALVKGAGRIIGRGGPYATRIHVDAWYLIGPFEGRHGQGLFANPRHPPETAVVLDAVYRGKDGRLLKWEYIDMASYPLIPPDPAEDAVYYGYTELMVDAEQDLTAWIGADDDAQLWLNDRLAWRGGNVNKQWFFNQVYYTFNTGVRDYNLSEGKRVLHLKKGRNTLFFKLSNGPTRLFFSLVLTK